MYNSTWYNNLTKPLLTPPDFVFAPVWSFLYLTIFIALMIYFLEPDYNKKKGYFYFAVQLFLNFIWSPIFFLYQNIKIALLIVILLDVFIFLTMKRFYSTSKLAGRLFIPYFLWALFATYLNFGYFILN